MAFSGALRSAAVIHAAMRGPPAAAAAICAATPTLLAPLAKLGPLVGAAQFGFEQRWPTSSATRSFVEGEKSSLPRRGVLSTAVPRVIAAPQYRCTPTAGPNLATAGR